VLSKSVIIVSKLATHLA